MQLINYLNKIKLVIFLLFMTAIIGSVFAQEGLVLEARRLRSAVEAAQVEALPESSPIVSIGISTVIRNVSDAGILIAKGIKKPEVVTFKNRDGSYDVEISLLVYLEVDLQGEAMVPSECELLPVLLQPGESTRIFSTVKLPRRDLESKITVVYDLDSKAAARFKMWSGRIQGKLLGPESESSVSGKVR